MNRYFFSIQAKQDLKQVVDLIARDNPAAARRLAAEIKRKAKATAEFPEIGHSYAYLLPSLSSRTATKSCLAQQMAHPDKHSPCSEQNQNT